MKLSEVFEIRNTLCGLSRDIDALHRAIDQPTHIEIHGACIKSDRIRDVLLNRRNELIVEFDQEVAKLEDVGIDFDLHDPRTTGYHCMFAWYRLREKVEAPA